MSGPFKMKGSPMQRNFGIGGPIKDKKKKHFLERDKVGPIVDENEENEENEETTEFTQSGSPVIPAPEEKVLDIEPYILSKLKKSEKKKY